MSATDRRLTPPRPPGCISAPGSAQPRRNFATRRLRTRGGCGSPRSLRAQHCRSVCCLLRVPAEKGLASALLARELLLPSQTHHPHSSASSFDRLLPHTLRPAAQDLFQTHYVVLAARRSAQPDSNPIRILSNFAFFCVAKCFLCGRLPFAAHVSRFRARSACLSIRARAKDMQGPLCTRAPSPETRSAPCPRGSIRFFVVVLGSSFSGSGVVESFFCRLRSRSAQETPRGICI